jgi:hypothetical protein
MDWLKRYPFNSTWWIVPFGTVIQTTERIGSIECQQVGHTLVLCVVVGSIKQVINDNPFIRPREC